MFSAVDYYTVFNPINFAISNKQLFVVFFLLGDSPASDFYVLTFRNTLPRLHRGCTMKMETGCFEMSAHEIQTLGNHPNQRRQHSENSENLKSKTIICHLCSSNKFRHLQGHHQGSIFKCYSKLCLKYACVLLYTRTP
jgi:hypothetical protein